MKANWKTEIYGLLLLAAMSLFFLSTYRQLPPAIPLDVAGEKELIASSDALLLALGTYLFAYLFSSFIKHWRIFKVWSQRVPVVFELARNAVLTLLAVLLAAPFFEALSWDTERLTFALFPLAALLIGNSLGKAEQNLAIGVRTPWTMRSKEVWEKTHVHAGRVLMLVALVSLLLVIYRQFNLMLVLFLAVPFWLVGASYYYYWQSERR